MVGEGWCAGYRSIIVIKGETRPEAHAAAVMSEPTRHGRCSVFQSGFERGAVDVDAGGVRGESMDLGGLRKGASFSVDLL